MPIMQYAIVNLFVSFTGAVFALWLTPWVWHFACR